MKFKQQINEVHPSIKFNFNFSNKEINFLDTIVYKTQQGKLETKFETLEHPESSKQSIPLAQALCLISIYLTNNEFQDSCDILRNKLIERGYKQQETNKGIERTKILVRQMLLAEKKPKNKVIEFHLYCGI